MRAMKRLVPWTVLAALAALLAVPAGAADVRAAAPTVGDIASFSPNGDGDTDVARVRYAVPRAGAVTIEVRDDRRRVLLRRALGVVRRGTHTWTWDGRGTGGRRLPDGDYWVVVRGPGGASEPELVEIDRVLRAGPTKVAPGDLDRGPAAKAVLYPHSTTVRDRVVLHPVLHEHGLRRGRLVVTGPTGEVVLRKTLSPSGLPRVRWEGRDLRTGRPLPPGAYRVDVRATDRAGNRGTAPSVTVEVSGDQLVWIEETRQVVPQDVDHPTTCGTWGASNGCGDVDPCGPVVPSALFPGGLSHQGVATCEGYLGSPGAETDSWFAVREAVRGLAAMRVSFAGAPTHAGETDAGTVRAFSYATSSDVEVTSATGGSTGWVLEPWGGLGASYDPIHGSPRMPPSALWSFRTSGTDSFDVASYTVDLRYLGIPG